MFAKYLLVVSICSGALVHQYMAQDVPQPYTEYPLPAVVHHKPEQHQQSIPSDRPEQLPGEHVHNIKDPLSHTHHYTDFFHNVPPAPEPSSTNYIATVSYGEGYPTVIYHCSLTDHKPTTPFVHSPNGHVCTVSFLRVPGNHELHRNLWDTLSEFFANTDEFIP